MKIILQHDERDCGAACLAMIASYYGIEMPLSRFREMTKTDRNGTNLYGLVDGAEQIGLLGQALSGTEKDLMEGIAKHEILFPFIAHTVSESAMLHFVVVYGYKNGLFEIADPGKGKCRLASAKFFERWTGYIVSFTKTRSFHPENQMHGRSMRFLKFWKGMLHSAAAILLLSMLTAGVGILGAFVFKVIMNDAINIRQKWALAKVIFPGMIGLYLLQGILQLVRGNLILSVSKKIDLNLSRSYYEHLIDIPISEAAVRQTGEYMSRLSDIATIRQALSGATLTLLLDTVMVIACGVILFLQSQSLCGIAFCMVIAYVIVVALYRKPIETGNRKMMEENANFQSYFKESVDGLETVKASCANKQVKERISEKFLAFIDAVVEVSWFSVSQEVITGSIEQIGTMMILWAGFWLVFTGKMETGTLITFYALLVYFTQPVKNLCQLQPMVQSAFVAAERLNDILEIPAEKELSESEDLPKAEQWCLQHIDFRYGNQELTLKDINFTFHRGEKIAIVGESGSGKTTLAKLLLRFYEPEKGEILLDDINLQALDVKKLRSQIAYVSQNTFLFADTVENNLKLGNPEVTDEEIQAVCKICCIDEFVQKLPLKYQTPLDENGANLSGGQRQRLAIARALLRKPQLLILDEATSNMDPITEEAIKNALHAQDAEMTSLIIAHRLSTIQLCDKIYVLHEGQIVESGRHQELIKQNGLYSRLWNAQNNFDCRNFQK